MSIAAIGLLLLSSVGCGGPPPMADLSPPPRVVAPMEAPVMPVDPLRRGYVERGPFPEYTVGPGDELELMLRDVKLVRETVEVRPDGNISFLLVENLYVTGMTIGELDFALTAAVERYLREPKIDVQVSEYGSKIISLIGAIETLTAGGTKTGQGRYALENKTYLLDLILEAGGTTPDAQLGAVQVIRDGQVYVFNLQRVLNFGDVSHNPILQGDDIIIVPGASRLTKKVVVLGEVNQPDVYLLASDASLLEAVSKAAGLNTTALGDDIRIIRPGEVKPEMFTVDFKRITTHGDLEQNVVLNNNDIIFVPRSFMGDVNDVITKIEPLLNVLLIPATYRDLYTTGGGLRVDTGDAAATGTTTGFTRPLPGVGKLAVPVEDEEQQEEDREAVEEEQEDQEGAE